MRLRSFGSAFTLVWLLLFFVVAPPYCYTQKLSNKGYEHPPSYQNALFIVDACVDELRDIQDLSVRTELTEQILNLLQKNKPARCRQMLDSLFDRVLNLKKAEESGDETQQADLDSIIRRIIRMAAPFDRKLAQSYILKYTEHESSDNRAPGTDTGRSPQLKANLQLKLATSLIAKDTALALSTAKSSLNLSISSQTLAFLGALRNKDISSANAFFAAALQSVKMRQGYNLNELLLLYSYVFSPGKVPYLSTRGLSLLQIPDYIKLNQNYSVDPVVARQYLQTSMQLVLDLSRYSTETVGRLSGGILGDLHFINLIEPRVAAYLPASAESLAQYKAMVTRYLQPDTLAEAQSQLRRWNSYGEETATDLLEGESGPSPYNKRNDRAYYSAALDSVKAKKYEKALQLLERISPESRDRAKELILFSIAEDAVTDSDVEKAENIARRDSNLLRRAYILTLVAEALLDDKKNDRVRAGELLTELGQIAEKVDYNKQRFAILSGAAAVSSRFDRVRAFEFIREAIKVANKVDGFDGDTAVGFGFELSGFTFYYPLYGENLTFYTSLMRLASEDFDGVLLDVRNLESRTARLKSLITVCGPVLSKEIPPRS